MYLVGAGPGDPGLLTIKGKRCLQRADVVLYDHLVNPRLLELTRSGAECIDVGKRRAPQPSDRGRRWHSNQERIHEILIERARRGKIVVRLKGGDPFVFGRGGEEAEALRAAGIPFEIVPGVTSAIAVPAYAGIPLTHRDHASSLVIVTGHQRQDPGRSEVAWEHLALGADTIVILMGMGRIEEIARKLIEVGRAPETPTCVIEWGTLPRQRSVTAPLHQIASRVSEAGLRSPGVIVVGDVVALAETLQWFQATP